MAEAEAARKKKKPEEIGEKQLGAITPVKLKPKVSEQFAGEQPVVENLEVKRGLTWIPKKVVKAEEKQEYTKETVRIVTVQERKLTASGLIRNVAENIASIPNAIRIGAEELGKSRQLLGYLGKTWWRAIGPEKTFGDLSGENGPG